MAWLLPAMRKKWPDALNEDEVQKYLLDLENLKPVKISVANNIKYHQAFFMTRHHQFFALYHTSGNLGSHDKVDKFFVPH